MSCYGMTHHCTQASSGRNQYWYAGSIPCTFDGLIRSVRAWRQKRYALVSTSSLMAVL